jgi:aldehyde oxidoreductase
MRGALPKLGSLAVLNAIYDAVGVRVFEMPATPEKLLAGIKAKGGAAEEYRPYYLNGDLYETLDEMQRNPVTPKK